MKKGVDVRISDTAVISRPELVEIGDHVSIDIGCYISTGMTIGDYVHVSPYVCIIGGADAHLIMEDFTNIAAGSKMLVLSDDFTKGLINPIVPAKYRNLIGGKIIMRRFSAVGVNSVVMPGIEMGYGSVLGANSTLTKDTNPWIIYSGSPAKPCGFRDKDMIINAAKELGYDI